MELPREWKEVELGEVAQIFDGTHQTPDYVDKGIPFVSVENINDIWGTDKFITQAAYDAYAAKPCCGDILMTRITAGVIGKTAVVESNKPLAYYVSLGLIRCDKDVVDPYYLSQYIEGKSFKKELNKRIIHTAFPKKINLNDIGKCVIAFPPLAEQKKIAETLSVWDSAIEKMEKLIDEKENLFKVELKEKIIAKGFEENWEKFTVKDCIVALTPPSRISQDNYKKTGNFPIIDQSKELIAGWTNDENCIIRSSNPLIIFGDHTCILKIMKIPFAQGADGIKVLSANENFDASFLYYSLKADPVVPEGYKRHYSSLQRKEVFCPSRDIQKILARYFEIKEKELSLLKQQLALYKKQKQGLMQKLLTGEWRVK